MRAFEGRLRKIETAQRQRFGTPLERMTDAQLEAAMFASCAQLERSEGPGWKDQVRAEFLAASKYPKGHPAYPGEGEFIDELLASYEALKG